MSFRRLAVVLAVFATIAPPAGARVVSTPTLNDVVLPPGPVRAGAAVVDSTWHVGASAGQYAGEETGIVRSDGTFEPYTHAPTSRSTYGLQGRETVRALVIEGSDGKRVAVVTNDLYIPQDLVDRRVAGLLAEYDATASANDRTGITDANMMISVSHSHSSPYYSTPSWGPWAFEDVFDIRYFDHISHRMAEAVIAASRKLVPVRVGASVSYFDLLQRHSFGPSVADDGTPAGFPDADFAENRSVAKTENEKMAFVVRFDDISEGAPKPLANWIVFGLHPEMLDGNDLLASEYVNTTERNLDREIGGVTLFSQENTGTAEPARDGRSQPASVRAEYSHREYGQVERAARLLTENVKKTRLDIENNTPEDPNQFAPFSTNFVVRFADYRFAPPSLRPTQTVSNCRTEKVFQGNPGIPVVGLPDCEFALGAVGQPVVGALPVSPSVTYETLRAAGVPVPDNYGFPSWTGLQETPTVHLQALRLGDIGITVCPCEQWGDQARNIRSRLNKIAGDFWDGFDWTAHTTPAGRAWCVQNGDTTWTCANPGNPASDLAPVSDVSYRRMKAQIHNDARGWDDLAYSAQAESEPVKIEDIKGNYTHEELTDHAYSIVIPVGMTNDYEGYISTYREFQRGDHYRKALTGLGPHSSDFLATRLSRMAANLNGATFELLGPKDLAYGPENTREYQAAQILGQAAERYTQLYEATLPADGGTAGITRQPASIKRFDAASVRWVGGDTYTDTPNVKVQRKAGEVWVDFANGFSEVQYRANYPTSTDLPAWRTGAFTWNWEATFEAMVSDIQMSDVAGNPYRATPAGTYRFVIDGTRREGAPAAETPYHLESAEFTVSPWDGITIEDLSIGDDGTVSFGVGPVNYYKYGASNLPDPRGYKVGPIDFPDTASALSIYPFIKQRNESQNLRTYGPGFDDDQQFCFQCSFRPWLDAANAPPTAEVEVTFVGGATQTFTATWTNGRYVTEPFGAAVASAQVPPGGVTTSYGEHNGTEASVSR